MTAPTGPDRTGAVARLDALEAAHKAATPGEWVTDVLPGWIHNNPVGRVKGGYIASVEHPADAAAIVAEHNALPALVAALGAVLDRHHRIGEGEPGREIDYCDYDGFVWPCEEYRAVAAALGEA